MIEFELASDEWAGSEVLAWMGSKNWWKRVTVVSEHEGRARWRSGVVAPRKWVWGTGNILWRNRMCQSGEWSWPYLPILRIQSLPPEPTPPRISWSCTHPPIFPPTSEVAPPHSALVLYILQFISNQIIWILCGVFQWEIK